MSQYTTHCLWQGVKCENDTETDTVIELLLTNNGLSGTLSDLARLTSLSVLDLSDNEINGKIPSTIGNLTQLTHLKLNYNAFIDTIPTEMATLKKLELLHLHGNRIKGNIVLTDLQQGYGESSFITDCGSPAIYDPVDCTGCTMCCNKDGDCQPDVQPPLLRVQALGFDTYKSFCGVLFGIVFGLCFILALVSYVANLKKDRFRQALSSRNLPTKWLSRAD